MKGSELTSSLTTLTPTTNPSDWDLRWSIEKAKPCVPGPDRVHCNLLRLFSEDKKSSEILNNIWTSEDFHSQLRGATVIPIPKPNQDHTNPLSYRSVALTNCLCKALGCHFPDDIFKCISWMKMYEFRLRFHWNLFLVVQTTISQHWFR